MVCAVSSQFIGARNRRFVPEAYASLDCRFLEDFAGGRGPTYHYVRDTIARIRRRRSYPFPSNVGEIDSWHEQ